MSSADDITELQRYVVHDLNGLSDLIGRFDKTIHTREPMTAKPMSLEPLGSVNWAASLAQTLANNTREFRDKASCSGQ